MFGFHVLCRRGSCLVSPQRVLFCAHPCPDATANSSYKTSNKESVSSTGRIQIVHIDSLRALRACVRVAVLISTVKHQFLSQSLSLSRPLPLALFLARSLALSLALSLARSLSLEHIHMTFAFAYTLLDRGYTCSCIVTLCASARNERTCAPSRSSTRTSLAPLVPPCFPPPPHFAVCSCRVCR